MCLDELTVRLVAKSSGANAVAALKLDGTVYLTGCHSSLLAVAVCYAGCSGGGGSGATCHRALGGSATHAMVRHTRGLETRGSGADTVAALLLCSRVGFVVQDSGLLAVAVCRAGRGVGGNTGAAGHRALGGSATHTLIGHRRTGNACQYDFRGRIVTKSLHSPPC